MERRRRGQRWRARFFYNCLLVTTWLLAGIAQSAEISVIDDTGQTVTLEKPAQRIVSLSPHLTEILFSAGLGERIVGTVEYSDYPEAAKNIPRIAFSPEIDLEMLVGLNPDLIVVWNSESALHTIELLTRLQAQIYLNEPITLDNIATTIERLGRLGKTDGTAKTAASEFRVALRRFRQEAENKKRLRVFYEMWPQPLMTLSKNHVISEVIELCGGINVFYDLEAAAPVVTVDSVKQADPEVIIGSGIDRHSPSWLYGWRKWPDIDAVKYDSLFHVPGVLLQWQSPRILKGVELVCWQLEQARMYRGR